MALRIYTGARGSKFVCDDTAGFGDAVAAISRRADAPITSCAREKAAGPLLHKLGKMSQQELFDCSQEFIRTGKCPPHCHGNCNPANRPGTSTHERRDDGIAYHLVPGTALRYWQRGIDVQRDRVHAFIAAARKEGWLVTQTYPSSLTEAQHVNFRRKPRISLWEFRPLKVGMGGPRAHVVIELLHRIQRPHKRDRYVNHPNMHTHYDHEVMHRLRSFQSDHGLKVTGRVDLGTYAMLRGMSKRPPSRVDQAGIDFLVAHEGEVLHVYNDPAGNATFGVGHLLHAGRFTDADAAKFGTAIHPHPREAMLKRSRAFLDADVAQHERAVLHEVPVWWRRSHDRFNALVSLSFNLGTGVLTPGAPLTTLGHALDRRPTHANRSAIADAILLYDKAGSPPKPLPGLTARRHDERALFLRDKG